MQVGIWIVVKFIFIQNSHEFLCGMYLVSYNTRFQKYFSNSKPIEVKDTLELGYKDPSCDNLSVCLAERKANP